MCQVNCVMQHNSALVREQLGDNPERLFLGKLRSGIETDLSLLIYGKAPVLSFFVLEFPSEHSLFFPQIF